MDGMEGEMIPSMPAVELSCLEISNKQNLTDSFEEIYRMMLDDSCSSNNSIHNSESPDSKNDLDVKNLVTEKRNQKLEVNFNDTSGWPSNPVASLDQCASVDLKHVEYKYQFENMSEKILHLKEQLENKQTIINLLRNEKEAISRKLETSDTDRNQFIELQAQSKLVQDENVRLKESLNNLLENKKELEMKNNLLEKQLLLTQRLHEKNEVIRKNDISEYEKKMEALKNDLQSKVSELSGYCLDHYYTSKRNVYSGYLNACNSTTLILACIDSWMMKKSEKVQHFIDLAKWKEISRNCESSIRELEEERLANMKKLESDPMLIKNYFFKVEEMPEVSNLHQEKFEDAIQSALDTFYELQCAKVQKKLKQSKASSTTESSSRDVPPNSRASADNNDPATKPLSQRVPTSEPRQTSAGSRAPTSASSLGSSSATSSSSSSKVPTPGQYNTDMKYYVVLKGFHPGVYHTRKEYQDEIKGYYDHHAQICKNWVEATEFMRRYNRLMCNSMLKGARGGYAHDEYGRVVVWIAGSCEYDYDITTAGSGVWFGPYHPRNQSEPVNGYLGYSSLNEAEIQAAILAIKQAYKAEIDSLVIRTESKYLVETVSIHLSVWKHNQWRRTNGESLANKESLRKLDRALQSLNYNVHWEWENSDQDAIAAAFDLAETGSRYYEDLDEEFDYPYYY
ncbi:hypothetical protein QAD02_015359 [Eretmocerus hayati]|uniref:Uncharacterized protein n=1 Tax=Eretmocerus hayati TaxID=131215 RepID=A0ACC2PAT5_9HYME|nr:hypothetical protein QAD02_015359 [Eretmocerus hayati]